MNLVCFNGLNIDGLYKLLNECLLNRLRFRIQRQYSVNSPSFALGGHPIAFERLPD